MKRSLVLALAALTAAACGGKPSAEKKAFDASTYTELTISDSDSLDPAWAYDTASDEIILNIYDTLVAFKGSSTTDFIPLLSEKVPSRANGLISADGRTYTFPIRQAVKFQDGTPLTPEDVRYSIMRFVLQDRAAGPSSILLQPLVGYPDTRDEKGQIKPGVFADVSKAVKVEGNDVVLRLPKPYAPLLSILASWAPIVSKTWAVKNGDWDGTEATWAKYNNPQKQASPFFERANGTGPFALERWDRRTHEFVLVRNDNYWREPAKLKYVVVRGIDEFSTRKLMIEAGDADSIYADRSVLDQVQNVPGVQVIDDLPVMQMDPIVFFTFHLNTTGNPYVGSGQLDGQGIPADFFADKDVRKGFAYAFDYQGYIRDVERGKGTQATGCIPTGVLGHDPDLKPYTFDLGKATEHFKKAMGGKVWDQGFRFTLTFNTGNSRRETICQMMKRSVESINPKFHVDVRPVDWPAFLDAQNASKLPIFVLGWSADYPDPHDFAFPTMHSQGNYPAIQHYSNPQADALVDKAIAETDPAKRRQLYFQLQKIEHDDVPHLDLVDHVEYRTQRDWTRGYVFNPVFPDAPWGAYYYTLYKEMPQAPAAPAPAAQSK